MSNKTYFSFRRRSVHTNNNTPSIDIKRKKYLVVLLSRLNEANKKKTYIIYVYPQCFSYVSTTFTEILPVKKKLYGFNPVGFAWIEHQMYD